MIKVQLSMMVVLTELFPFIQLSVILIVCQPALTEKKKFLSDYVETLYDC